MVMRLILITVVLIALSSGLQTQAAGLYRSPLDTISEGSGADLGLSYFKDSPSIWSVEPKNAVTLPGSNIVVFAALRNDKSTAPEFAWVDLARGRAGRVGKSESDTGTAFSLAGRGMSGNTAVDCAFSDGATTAFFCVWDPAEGRAKMLVVDAPFVGDGGRGAYARYVIDGIGNNATWRVDSGAAMQKPAVLRARGDKSTHAVFSFKKPGSDTVGERARVSLSSFSVAATSTAASSQQRFTGSCKASGKVACFTDYSAVARVRCYDAETLDTELVSTQDGGVTLQDFVSDERLLVSVSSGGSSLRLWQVPTAKPSDPVPRQLGDSYNLPSGLFCQSVGYDPRRGIAYVAAKKSGGEAQLHAVFAHWASSSSSMMMVKAVYDPASEPLPNGGAVAIFSPPRGMSRNVLLLAPFEASSSAGGRVVTVGPAIPGRSRTLTATKHIPSADKNSSTLAPSTWQPRVAKHIGLDNTTRMGLHVAAYVLASLPSIYFCPTIGFTVMRGVRLDPLFCRGGRGSDAPIQFFPATIVPTLKIGDTVKGRETRAAIVVYCAVAFGLAVLVAVLKPYWSKETGQERWTPPGQAANEARRQEPEPNRPLLPPLLAPPSVVNDDEETTPGGGKKKKKRKKKGAAAAAARQQEALRLQQEQQRQEQEARRRRQQQQQQAAKNRAEGPPRPRPLYSYVGLALCQLAVPWGMAAGYLFGIPELTGQALAVMPFILMIVFFVIFTWRLGVFVQLPSMKTLRVAPAFVVRGTPIEKATAEMLRAEKLLGGTLGQVFLVGGDSWEVPVPAPPPIVDFYNCAKLIFTPFWGPYEVSPAILATSGGATIEDSWRRKLARNWVLISGIAGVAVGVMMGHATIDRDFCSMGRIAVICINFLHAAVFLLLRPYIIPMHNIVVGTVEVLAAIVPLAMLFLAPDLDDYNIADSSSLTVLILEVLIAGAGIIAGLIVVVCGFYAIHLMNKGNCTLVNPTRRHLQVASNNLLSFLSLDFGQYERGAGGGGAGGFDDNDDDAQEMLQRHPPSNNNNSSNHYQQQQQGGGGGYDDDDDDQNQGDYYDDEQQQQQYYHPEDDYQEGAAQSIDQLGGPPPGQQQQQHRRLSQTSSQPQHQSHLLHNNDSLATSFAFNNSRTGSALVPRAPSSSVGVLSGGDLTPTSQQQQHQLPTSAELTPAEQKHLRFHEFLQRKEAELVKRNPAALKPKWPRKNNPHVQEADLDKLDQQLDAAFRPLGETSAAAAAEDQAFSSSTTVSVQQQQPTDAGSPPSPTRNRSVSIVTPKRTKQEQQQELYSLTHSLETMMGQGETVDGIDQHLEGRIGALLTADQMARAAEEQQQEREEADGKQEEAAPAMRQQMVRLRAFFDKHNPHKSDLEVEQAVVAWAGRWDEMWSQLSALYGDEPPGTAPSPEGTQWQVRSSNHQQSGFSDSDSSPSPSPKRQRQPRSMISADAAVAAVDGGDGGADFTAVQAVKENAVLKEKMRAMERQMEMMKQQQQQQASSSPTTAGQKISHHLRLEDSLDDDDDDDDNDDRVADGGDGEEEELETQVMSVDAFLAQLEEETSPGATAAAVGNGAATSSSSATTAAASQQQQQQHQPYKLDDDDQEEHGDNFLPPVPAKQKAPSSPASYSKMWEMI